MTSFIPIFQEVTSQPGVKLTDAAVFGAVWFYSYQGAGYCSKSPKTLGQELGCTHNPVRVALRNLCKLGLIEDLTPDAGGAAHHYRPTCKAMDLLPGDKRLPESGNPNPPTLPESGNVSNEERYQKLVTLELERYQNLVTTLPESGNPNPPTLPESGNEKKESKNLKESDSKKEGGDKSPPPASADKTKKPVPAAVSTYRSVAHLWPDKAIWPRVAETVGDSPADLAFWQHVVTSWIGCGWNKRNIQGMLEFFKRREVPSTSGGKQNAAHKNGFGEVNKRQEFAFNPLSGKVERTPNG